MRIINYLFLIVVFLVFNMFNLFAQDKTIRGTVTTFENIPLSKVNVKVKSTGQEVITDSLGNFTVNVSSKDVLVVSANGFNKQRVKLKPQIKFAAINLNLKSGTKAKAYAIGYGHIMDVEKLNAVSNLNTNDLDFSQYNDIYDILRGRFSGVRIVDGEVIVRGKNTFDNSTNAALIVVDGVQRDERALSDIPTNQVKSIDVIKDGSAAIYGAEGANGVVLIETRNGSERRK